MILNLLAWMFSGLMSISCLFLAYSAWRQEEGLSGRGRMSLLVALLEAAMIAALLRLVVQWSPGTVMLWVVAVAALAAASAGVIIRWHDLPVRSRFVGSAATDPESDPDSAPEAGKGAAGEPVDPRESAEAHSGTGATSTATALRNPPPKTSSKKSKKPKQSKKEPGWPAVVGHACCLGAAVALSFFVG